MADTAFKTMYREEYVAAFERGQSVLRACTTTEVMMSGQTATFLVAGTGGAEAVTRGVNGNIPSRADDLNQYTATLAEWHDKPRRTKFNIFGSQGNGRRIMQEGSVKVLNRKIDDDIITELNTATQDTGAAATGSLALAMHAQTILGNNDVDIEDQDNLFFLATPAFRGYLMQTKEFASKEYVEVPMFSGPARKMVRWAGFNWIFHTGLPGKATNAEKCFAFHRDAIGHAFDTEGMDVAAGYNEEDSYYWARASAFMGSKLLQNSGVVVVNHDGSAFAAQ